MRPLWRREAPFRGSPPLSPIPKDIAHPADPAVKSGTLPNGMRYAVMRNATPGGALSFRLAVDVGSFEEGEEERGIAHFLEHMAFRSTRAFPAGALEKKFAPLGVAFGRDQNAATSLTSTVYRVDLPAAGADQVDSALGWLRGVADGMLLDEAEVEKERGVVLAERQARANSLTEIQEEVTRFQAPNVRSVNRNPGGTDAALRRIGAPQLRSFYDRWYRPENAVLVIVGDLPVEALEAKARAAFSGWSGRGAPGVRAKPAPHAAAERFDAFTRSAPNAPYVISACRIGPADPEPASDLHRLRRDGLDAIWTTILTQRLARVSTAARSPMLGAAPLVAKLRDVKNSCLAVLPNAGNWRPALAAAQAELRRFAEEGPTDIEVETAIESIRSAYRGAIAEAGTRTTPSLADTIAEAQLERTVFGSPRQAMRAYNIAVDGVDGGGRESGVRRGLGGQRAAPHGHRSRRPRARGTARRLDREPEGRPARRLCRARRPKAGPMTASERKAGWFGERR